MNEEDPMLAIRGPRLLLPFGALFLLALSLPGITQARQDAQQTPPDNTKMNKDQGNTADQQKTNSSDQGITQKIRRSIIEDKSLSTYAHNVKIITQNGTVTLKGPVRSEDEKSNIEAKAAAVAGQDNVHSEIEVKQ
jgi:hyperosmotically inducible protein